MKRRGLKMLFVIFAMVAFVSASKKNVLAYPVSTAKIHHNQEGQVFKISGNRIRYRCITGTDTGISYGRWKSAKATKTTLYYRAIGFKGNGLIIKESTKERAIKSGRKSYNYSYFKVKNGKILVWIFNVEKYVS